MPYDANSVQASWTEYRVFGPLLGMVARCVQRPSIEGHTLDVGAPAVCISRLRYAD